MIPSIQIIRGTRRLGLLASASPVSLFRLPPDRKPSRALGFTLVELISVMSVIVVLMAMAGPAITGLSKSRSLSHAMDRAWSAASQARQTAITTGVPVALILTQNRQAENPDLSDAFVLLKAERTSDASGATAWKWVPSGAWLKLPNGVQVLDRPEQDGDHSFYDSASQPPGSSYAQLEASLPKLEGESIDDFLFVVFRPDGSVDSPSSIPFMEFKRLRANLETSDSALILNRETGRTRMVRFN